MARVFAFLACLALLTACAAGAGPTASIPLQPAEHRAAAPANVHPHSPYEWWFTNNDSKEDLWVYNAYGDCMTVGVPQLLVLGKHGSDTDAWRGVVDTSNSDGCFYFNSVQKLLLFYGGWEAFKKGRYIELDYTKYWALATEKWRITREGGDGGFADTWSYAPIKTYCQLNTRSPFNIVCVVP